MNQAFFTLSVGMGGMAIFGSYIGKERSLMGESVNIIVLDTFVAVVAGMIMFPACFTYGLEVTSGPSLLFDTMAGVFNHMDGGRWWGTLFFLFMVFAAMSTVLGVCENILAMIRELTVVAPQGLRGVRRGHVPDRADHGVGFQCVSVPALCRGFYLAGFLGFHRFHQCVAPGFAAIVTVLLLQIRLGLGEFPGRGQRGQGTESAALDEAAVPLFVPAAIFFIYIYGMVNYPWR